MTATPETTTDTQHHFLTGLAQQARYAHEFARDGRTKEALEHCAAIERLIAAYRNAIGQQAEPDTLAAWLHQRFMKTADASSWNALTDEGRAYWEHQARAVRRAVARGGFKERTGE